MTNTLPDLSTQATQQLDQSISEAINSAPEIGKSPGLAVTAAQQVSPSQSAQTLAGTSKSLALTDSAQKASAPLGGTGIFGDIMGGLMTVGHDVGSAISHVPILNDATTLLNKGLSQVQHEYRYIHDVEATHGMMDGILSGLGIAAGAVGGFALGGGPEGAILGADAVEGLEGQLLFHDSWNRSGEANYVDPHTHQAVSFGRDIAHLMGFHPGTGTYNLVSGLGDAAFDYTADPLANLGRLHTLSLDGNTSGVVADMFPKARPTMVEDIQGIYDRYGDVRRGVDWIANHSAGEIAAQYPELKGAIGGKSLFQMLGDAGSHDEVLDVYRQAITARALSYSDRLPSMSLTRVPFSAMREWASNTARPDSALLQVVSPRYWADNLERVPLSRITPDDASNATDVYRYARFSQSREVAAQVATDWINAATPAERILMWRNLTLENMFGLAHMRPLGSAEDYFNAMADGVAKSKIKETLDEATGGAEPGANGIYGMDGDSHLPTEGVVNEDDGPMQGKVLQAGVLTNHTGYLTAPGLRDIRQGAKILQGSKDLFGRADDFAYAKATQGIFKPLVLLTPSYAMHIALAELIPNGMRLGFSNLVRAGIAANYSHLDSMAEDDPERLNAIQGLVYRVLGGTRGARIDPVRASFSARVIDFLNGDTLTSEVTAGEAYSREVLDAERYSHSFRWMAATSPKHLEYSRSFGTFGAGDIGQSDAWQTWLKEIANDEGSRVGARTLIDAARRGLTPKQANFEAVEAVKRWLDDQPESYLQNYVRHTARTQTGIDNGLTAHEDWARVKVSNIRAAVTGARGRVHVPLLDRIANGEWVDAQELDKIGGVDRAVSVKGRQIVPNGDGAIGRIAGVGFRKVLNPMVNILSREPIFHAEAFKQFATLKDAVDAGVMSDDEAFSLAMSRASSIVLKNVHNLHDRTQWTVTMRNIAPFWFAQEQAYRRMGRLLAEDPGAFRRYQLAISGVHNVAFNQTDSNGTNYVVFPGTGWMTGGVATIANKIGLPVTGSSLIGTGFSLSSTSVMFPLANGLRPDVGPVAAIPVAAIASLFPESSPKLKGDVVGLENTLLGGAAASQPLWQQVVPNTFVQRVMSVWLGDNGRSFQSAVMDTMQSLDYQQSQAMAKWEAGGSKGAPPEIVPPPTASAAQMQAFIDRVTNNTRIAFLTRAILGLGTPIAPEVQIQNWGLPTELSQDITKTGSLSAGVQEFLTKHPNATPFTVFQSTGQEGPAPADSQQAENWIDSNIGFIQKYPIAALWFMPQLTDTKYSAKVYNEQLAQGLRVKYDSANAFGPHGTLNTGSYLAQLYIAAGNSEYYNVDLPAHQAAQQTLTGDAKTQEQIQWDAYLKNYEAQNPVWADWKGSADRANLRLSAISQIETIFNENAAPPGPMTDAVRGLLNDWNTYSASVQYARVNGLGTVTAQGVNWQNYLDQVKRQRPELSAIINSVFQNAAA